MSAYERGTKSSLSVASFPFPSFAAVFFTRTEAGRERKRERKDTRCKSVFLDFSLSELWHERCRFDRFNWKRHSLPIKKSSFITRSSLLRSKGKKYSLGFVFLPPPKLTPEAKRSQQRGWNERIFKGKERKLLLRLKCGKREWVRGA